MTKKKTKKKYQAEVTTVMQVEKALINDCLRV